MALQLIEQALLAHEGNPFWVPHTVPQPPQFAVELVVLVSQPLLGLLSQFPKPLLHTGTQAVPLQLVVPFELVQALVQLPQ